MYKDDTDDSLELIRSKVYEMSDTLSKLVEELSLKNGHPQ